MAGCHSRVESHCSIHSRHFSWYVSISAPDPLHPDPFYTVDGPILNVFLGFVVVTISMITSLGAVVFLTPLFLLPGIFAAIIGGGLGQLFIKVFLFDSPVLLRLLMGPLDTAVG
jgi:hypothetical protein